MSLTKFVVNCVNRCHALLGAGSHFETTFILTLCLLLQSGFAFAAEKNIAKSVSKNDGGPVIEVQDRSKADLASADQLIQSLQKESISIRRDGSTIRMRFLRGSKELAPAIRDLQVTPHKLFEKNMSSALGPGSSGGGFANYYSSYSKTIEDVQAMINQFNRMPPELLRDYLPSPYKNIVTAKKLTQALEKIRISFFQEGLTVAPNGMVDILEADYVSQGAEAYIILLKSFFEKYNSIAKDDQLSFLRSRVILHEISHLFGIGTVQDKESWDLSFYLLLALASENRFCVSTVDCESPAAVIRKQYNSQTYELERLEKIKKEIETDFNLAGLKLNAAIRHGLFSDITTGSTNWKILNSESITILVPADLKNILPDEFKDISKNTFAAQLLASLSLQKNTSFNMYRQSISDLKSRLSSYEVNIFEARTGILYSKQSNELNNWNHTEEQKRMSAQFFKDRGDCYGEKIERPQYRWSLDSQNKICIGQPHN